MPWSTMSVASVASTGARWMTRTRNPLASPTAMPATSATSSPAMTWMGPEPGTTMVDRQMTTSPVSGPTERSMPPIRSTTCCPMLTNARALASSSIPWKLSSVKKRPLTLPVYSARSTMSRARMALGP